MSHNVNWLLIVLLGTSPLWARLLYWGARATLIPMARTIQDYFQRGDPSDSWQKVFEKIEGQLARLKQSRFDDLGIYNGFKEDFLVDGRRARVGVKTIVMDDLVAAVYVYGWLRYYNNLEGSQKYRGIGYLRRRDGATGPLPWRGRFYMRTSGEKAKDYHFDRGKASARISRNTL